MLFSMLLHCVHVTSLCKTIKLNGRLGDLIFYSILDKPFYSSETDHPVHFIHRQIICFSWGENFWKSLMTPSPAITSTANVCTSYCKSRTISDQCVCSSGTDLGEEISNRLTPPHGDTHLLLVLRQPSSSSPFYCSWICVAWSEMKNLVFISDCA